MLLTKNKQLAIIFIILFALILFFVIHDFYPIINRSFIIPKKKFVDIQLGMTDLELMEKYGKPKYIIMGQKSLDRYPEEYDSYYPHPTRKISNKVYIYDLGSIYVVFIYFDKDNKVEFKHLAKT